MIELKDLCTKGSSSIAQKDLEGHDGIYPIYGASGFIKNVDFYQQEKPYIAVVKDGAGVGRVMCLPKESSVIGTMQYIIPNDGVNVKYLAYALEHLNLAKYYTGATIPHIYFKDYCKEKLPAHPPEDQSRIASILGRVTDLIALRKEQLAALDQLVKSRFIELFGDPIKNDMGWESKPLNEVCDGIGDGLHGTPEYDDGGEYPFINGNNLIDGKIVITPATKMVSEETYKKHLIDISTNAILISINGTLGKLAFYNGERVMLGKSACYCNLKQNINKVFVYGVMKSDSFTEFLDNSSTKSTIKNVGLKTMREFKLILPSAELQKQFAAFVEQVDKSKSAIQRSLDELETLRKALMQKYFG